MRRLRALDPHNVQDLAIATCKALAAQACCTKVLGLRRSVLSRVDELRRAGIKRS